MRTTLLLLAIILPACGGDSGLLVGTWGQSGYAVASVPPGDLTSSELDLTFDADGSSHWTLTAVFSHTASQVRLRGCTEVTIATGLSWSASATGTTTGSLTVSGTPYFSVDDSGCDDPAADHLNAPTNTLPFLPSIDDRPYQLAPDGATLTVEGVTLTRR